MFRSLLSVPRLPRAVRRVRPGLEQLEARTTPTAGWAVNFAIDHIFDVAVDDLGNVYASGQFQGTADFDPGPGVSNLTSAGGTDAYVTKFAADGSFLWARRMGGIAADASTAIEASAGGVFVTGGFENSSDFGGITLTSAGAKDVYVARLDGDGNFTWATRLGGTNDDLVRGLAVDALGSVLTTGSFTGTVDFDSGPGTSELTALGGTDVFIAKLEPNGAFAWARRAGSSTTDIGLGIDTDPLGNVYVGGTVGGTADFGPFSVGAGVFVSKLDGSGNFHWAVSRSDLIADNTWNNLAVDARDADPANWAVYRGAGSDGTVVAKGLTVSKLQASNGLPVWDRVFAHTVSGTLADDGSVPRQARGLAVGPTGDVYLTGWVGGETATDFDPGPGTAYLNGYDSPTTDNEQDAFLLRLDGNGNYVAARLLGSAELDRGAGLAVDGSGNAYLSGTFRSGAAAGPGWFDTGDQTVTLDSATGIGYLVKLDTSFSAIGGRVIHDADGDGQNDNAEFGLQGRTVYLDQNSNGQLDSGEPTTVTDRRGTYNFAHLPAGTYTVAQVPQADWSLTTPSSATVTVADGQFHHQTFGNAVLATTVRTYASANVPVSTVQGQWVTSTITIPDNFNIFDIDVRVSATHNKVQELTLVLAGPDGSEVYLYRPTIIGAGKHFTNTIFDMEATLRLLQGTAPYTGRFRPSETVDGFAPSDPALSWWDGQLTAGTWTLKIRDSGGTTTGTLTSWDLLITTKSEPLPPPTISIGDVSLSEGNSGTQTATFTVSLSNPSAQAVTVAYATADGTATTANNDYSTVSQTITFLAGQTSLTITVPVNGDTTAESNETFFVNLSNPTNATLGDAQGVGTILDDDSTKFFVVNDGSPDQTYRYGTAGNAQSNSSLTSGNTAPRGAASTAAGTTLWVLDANKTVYVYSAGGNLIGSWTAGSLASNAQVQGITTNGTDVWIVDSQQDKVFKYTGAASRTSGSQNAASSFNLGSGNGNPTGIVTDGTSLWVVNDAANTKVFKYTLTGTLLGSWTADAANATPTGITLDPSNPQHLWIVDSGTDRVYQYDNAVSRTSGSQGAVTSFALAAGNTNPQDIADPPVPGGASSPVTGAGPMATPLTPPSLSRGPDSGAILSTIKVGSVAQGKRRTVTDGTEFDWTALAVSQLLELRRRRR